MEIITTIALSLAILLGYTLCYKFIVPYVLGATVSAGAAASTAKFADGVVVRNGFVAFIVMLTLLLGWAYAILLLADFLASEEIGNRWFLLFTAFALAGAPYFLFQQQTKRGGIAFMLEQPLQSSLEYAGGVQSKVVAGFMVAGYWFDWWPHLPG